MSEHRPEMEASRSFAAAASHAVPQEAQTSPDRHSSGSEASTLGDRPGGRAPAVNEKLGSPAGGIEKDGQQLYSHGFFDPALSPLRKMYFKIIISGLFLTILTALGVLSIYWAVLWQPDVYVPKLQGLIVDYDGALFGQTVTQALQQVSGQPGNISWYTVPNPAQAYPGGFNELAEAVVQERTWVVVMIQAGATANYRTALANADASWNGAQQVIVFANEARNNNAYGQHILPSFQTPLSMAAAMFAQQQARQLANTGNLAQLLANAPQLVTRPLYFTVEQLRPFNVPVVTAASYVGLIYLVILAFIVSNQAFAARQPLENKLRLTSLIAMRVVTIVVAYFFLSAFYAMLTLAFQAPFSRYYGPSGFVIYWMLSWVGMLALGGAMEAAITLLGQKFASALDHYECVRCLLSDRHAPRCLYGRAMPFHHIKSTVLAILLNTKNEIGLNFGVLIAFAVVSLLVTMPLFTVLTRRRAVGQTQREIKQAREDKA